MEVTLELVWCWRPVGRVDTGGGKRRVVLRPLPNMEIGWVSCAGICIFDTGE